MNAIDTLRADLADAASSPNFYADDSWAAKARQRRCEELTALDALITDRARLHHVVAQLQAMAAEKYAEARAHAFGFSAGDRLTLSHRRARLRRYATDAQRDAAALSALVRQALGIEEPRS